MNEPEKKTKKVEKVEEVIKFPELNGKFLHVKVGNPSWVGKIDGEDLEKEVEKVRDSITKLFEDNKVDCLVFVTHYAVELNLIQSTSKYIKE